MFMGQKRTLPQHHMNTPRHTLALALTALALASTATAQVVLSTSTYTQDFNSLPTSGNTTWTDNTSIVGWYTYFAFTSAPAVNFNANVGTTTTAGLYNYGLLGTNALADRAIGGLSSSSSTGVITIALRLQNNSGQTIDTVTVGYTGEQYRSSGTTAGRAMNFSYSTSATGAVVGTYSTVSGNPLNFAAPVTNNAGGLDGNASANRTVFSATSLSATALNWTNGTDLWLRWQVNTTGNAQSLAIDDLTVTATLAPIPEPSTAAALAGFAALALVATRRRRTSR
jgi:hypothetical protein